MAAFGGWKRAGAVIRLLPEKALIRILADGAVTELPVDAAMLDRGEIPSALTQALSTMSKYPAPLPATFILPHCLYGVDYISLPAIKKSRLEESFKTELRSMYKNYDELIFRSADIYTGRASVTSRVVFTRRELLDAIRACFAKVNLQVTRFVPYGVSVLEGAAKLNSAVRKTPCLVLDIGDKYSYIAAFGKDTLLGGAEIPFGAEALSDTRVMSERVLYQHDSAELLVINARERAKSTKLTMAINLEEEKIDDSILSDEDEVAPNPELPDLTHAGEEQTATDADEFDDDDETPEQAPLPTVKTLRKSAVRQLPKFMRREEPTTKEGYLLENFRLFERRVLLTARDMALSEYFPRIEAIYLSLPEQFAFIADEMNQSNSAYHWAYLKRSAAAPDDLPMGGALGAVSGKMPVF